MVEAGSLIVQIEEDWFSRGSAFWGYGLWLINLLVNFFALIILHLLFGKTLEQIANHPSESRIKVLAVGSIFLFGLPVLAAFCLISILGIPFGVLLLVIFVLSLWLGNSLAALLITYYLNARNVNPWNFWTIILLSLAIVTVVDLLILFPLLGVIVYLFILAFTYGICIQFIWDTQLQKRQLIE